ncbi:MAG: hypothetical protein K940chlam2_01229 [Chlamydiae bacterium]|nr:hypothetical protein [Chlamydiota bacterium]
MDAPPPPYILSADLLYWTARETGTAFAIKDGRVLHPSFKSHFGFKALLAVPLPHDGWQLALQFTHFHARVTETLSGGTFLPTWTHPALGGPTTVSEVFSRWRLHLGVGDLILSRCLPISDWLSLTPIVGLRAAGIRFKTRVDYQDDDLSMKNKYWGVGPRFGFESEAAFTTHWAFYGRWALSTLWGEYYIHQDEELAHGKLKYLDGYWAAIAIKEMALGLQWEHYFWKSCASLRLRLGWEMHLFPSQNQWVQFPSGAMPAKTIGNLGGLSLQGLTLGLLWEF